MKTTLAFYIFGLSVLSLVKPAESKEQPPIAATVLSPTGQIAGVDTNLVEQKIQLLGLRDDTLSYEQQPYNWLWERREQLVAPLVTGIQSTNLETAHQCLRLLESVEPTPALADALFKVAENPQHPLRASATLSLCRFAGDPRVLKLLESSWTNAAVFPSAGDRARLAEATGHRPEAAQLFGTLLSTNDDNWDFRKIFARLATNGTPAALSILSQAADDKRWRYSVAARLALAKADPAGHALTAAQKEFLETAGFGFKQSSEHHRLRCQKLAALPREEIRPLLRHMLTTDQGGDAAFMYGIWRDPEALPEIRRHALSETGWRMSPFIAAWLLLDESSQPMDELLEKIRTADNELRQEDVLKAVAEADLPLDRQLAFFREVRDRLKLPKVVADTFLGCNRPTLCAALFEEETDLGAIGQYGADIGTSSNPAYEKPLRRAVEIIADAAPAVHKNQSLSYGFSLVVKAAAVQQLRGLDTSALRLMNQPEPWIAIPAARLAAGGTNRQTALAFLNRELGNQDKYVRQNAAESLLGIPCANNDERRQREAAVLSQLDQPAEDYALRVLTTCAGPQTLKQLEPRLDGTNAPAARYAAWVLAQTANPELARKALRRLALHTLFCVQFAQQSSGIGFEVAPDLWFGQTIWPVDNGTNINNARQGLDIPADLMLPTSLNSAEQAFLVRDYRDVFTSTRQYVLGNYFMMFATSFGTGAPTDATYLPMFEVAAREDPTLQCRYVQGRKVAHFPYRQAAAKNMVRLTGKPATYLGLAGETLAADQVPAQPYLDQNLLIARLLLDRIQAANLKERPASDRDWSRVGYFNDLIQRLTDESQFGADLKDAILREAERRELGSALQNAGFSLWR